jgi:ribosomal protein S18 acetylase RimI-like enzyme
MEYRVRNYTDDLFERLLDFYRETIGGVFLSGKKGQQFLEMILHKPHFDPEQDFFVAEHGNAVSGLLIIYSEFKIKRIVMNCHVHHNFSYQKVASSLWDIGRRRCQEIGGDMIHVCLPENFSAGRIFFARSGFSPVRVHVELERNLEKSLQSGREPENGQVGHFDEGDEPRLAELQNRIFSGSWGFSPNSTEEIEYYLNLTHSKVSDILILKEGDNPIGYFWAHPSVADESGTKKGRIHMFGISPEFQGRGLGKKLLRIGLEDLRDKGYHTVDLTVDEANHPAFALYDSMGFEEKFTSLWYERSLKLLS